MPATPKSPRSKKSTSISKPKGAVRAKSGCYTCRIRRKKCDEKRMGNQEEGPCETCFRLKLECLGFGAKRPDWLRETSRVSEIRDRIKAHLAAQGMIKGHAGSGSRSAVQEDILRLSDYREGDMIYPSAGSSSSSSSPRRGDSMESDQPYGYAPHTASRPMFDHHRYDQHDHLEQYPVHSDIPSRSDSPCDTAMNSSVYDEGRDQSLYLSLTRYDNIETPARRSTFSKNGLYEFSFDNLYTIEPEEPAPRTFGISYVYPSNHIPSKLLNDSLKNYVDNVVKIQYLLGDRQILPNMIWEAINNHDDSKEAVTLLSKAYYSRQLDPQVPVLSDREFEMPITTLKVSLASKKRETRFNSDDAMTALHVVSLYLFDGGGGDWLTFLNLAVSYTEHVLKSPANPAFLDNYPATLEAASAKDEFVVKTTIWFDVLASITTQKPPQLLSYIRELFRPNLSWVGTPQSYSMMSPMGCQNQVVWALAETSYLSYWKKIQQQQGTLSIADLVRRVADIDVYLEEGPLPERPQKDEEDWTRYLASEIFRTATRLFLRTVESGDYPKVTEIRQAVYRTFQAIRNFPKYLDGSHQSAVVRSTVFGIFICGALSDDPELRNMLKIQLEQNQGGVNGVGNCGVTSGLLDNLWFNRRPNDGQPVKWRDILKVNQILLV
ncbi:ustiloxin B cluster transcription factor ustR [Psilocybe cubensis]|uniref:Ustiloxin B cluster transcription factor ustR n=2 Tax=Psilocybe cubensis TaxID=181762 RepID=A0ACB8H0E5_PSICU|nr:ustiloxin B cluster transcription factor ustR [Psilocybe cubensis]KAH9481306.1 ustiloxin B cluster transcription factor ustR [Psilocybe cubensis]